MKTLILRYPSIVGKKEEVIDKYFKQMALYNVAEEEAMKCLLSCPRLISFDIEK